MSNESVWRTNPHDIEPMIATNPNIKGEVHVRILSRTPTVLENTFPPNTWLGRHVHASDTLYIIKEGEFHIEGEGVFRPGDVRFVAKGHAYGPEWAGPDGAKLLIVAVNGNFGTDWV
ncbi:MAG: hypothetical protein KGQ43_09185 [Acidobacteria bacterium]|nr:hypothetical protein [Acidobacteriota bacterium]